MNLPLNHSLAVAPCLCFLFQELIRHTVWDTLDAYFHAFVYFGSRLSGSLLCPYTLCEFASSPFALKLLLVLVPTLRASDLFGDAISKLVQ